MSDKIRIGIIGCSTIARNSTLPAILKSNNTKLEYIGSRSNNKALEFSKIFDCEKFGTYDDVIPFKASRYLSDTTGIRLHKIDMADHNLEEWAKSGGLKKVVEQVLNEADK